MSRGATNVLVWMQFLAALSPRSCFLSNHWPETSHTWEDNENDADFPIGVKLKDGDTYDYIVVGAGAAGCVVAARLALLGLDVLLVEAGGNPHHLSKIPSLATAFLGSKIDWQYQTIPNNVSCLGSRGGQCRFSRGKCLGGSTSINYMLYTRGHRHDFNYNITDWNWEDLEPYFLRYEGLQALEKIPPSSIRYHNTTGILKLDYFDDPQNSWHSRIINGFRSLNFPYNRDVNGKSQIGVSKLHGYVYKGERMSTARAYLKPNNVRRNLKIAKNMLCTGVIIDEHRVTRGITVLPKMAKKPLQLFARKEVILSAGAIGTPQILMLSGIGPATHLEDMGIPVRVNLPVGDNMSDHVLPLVIVLVDKNIKLGKRIVNALAIIAHFAQFLARRNGPIASNGLTDVNAFANTFCYDLKQKQLLNYSKDDCELPNLQVIPAYINKSIIKMAKPVFQQSVNLKNDIINQLADANDHSAFIIMSNILLTPYSRGRIRLASRDPSKPPAIFANYLSDARDVDLMLRSIKIIEDLVETPEFKNNNATVLHLKFPGCPSYEENQKGYWLCHVRHMTSSVFHAVGTCSLGRVVDTRLRVKGVQRLRVVDASVIPIIQRGNTEAAVVAFAERLVDFIMETLRGEGT